MRKSKELSRRRGAEKREPRVVSEAVVEGGRTDGLGRSVEEGIVRRRCVARVVGRARRRVEMRILMRGGWCWVVRLVSSGGDVEAGFWSL